MTFPVAAASCCCLTDFKLFLCLQSAFQTKEAYYKAIGYREEDGAIESTDKYVSRLSLCVKLYAAIVQVCPSCTHYSTIPLAHIDSTD